MFETIMENFRNEVEKIMLVKDQNHLTKANLGIDLCNKTLFALKEITDREDFETVPAEINFFKEVKPLPMSYLIYFSEVRSCELRKPKAGAAYQSRFFEKEIRKINKFFYRNVDFAHYMEQGYNYLDHQIFTRNYNKNFPFTPTINYYQYPEFSTSHDMLWSKIKAMYLFLHYIRDSMQKIRPESFALPAEKRHRILLWTASKTALVELIYALYCDEALNHGSVDLKTITQSFEDFFNTRLDNTSKTYTEIKARKGSKTKYLDELGIKFQLKMEREDGMD
ncbi:RteC domain-containing protein [Autumnicola musiva]|uniref:RteC domain-containing protein n=1 Tax=Autumnicola musiva TaxID=3075589 RepID=A0ABU3DAX7_9FLAO|nr:RteC domain-containing protein [Zunongwangia sp. F117]MDT0678683.1 RteC domain-containing protein [Zunongwangia sp. F117]